MSTKRKRVDECISAGGGKQLAGEILIHVAAQRDSEVIRGRLAVPVGALIDDLKPMVILEFSSIFSGLSGIDIVVSAEGIDCPEDTPISAFMETNCPDQPLLAKIWSGGADNSTVTPYADASVGLYAAASCSVPQLKVIYMELKEGISDKFYELKQDGSNVTIRYGRRGTSGTKTNKSFSSITNASKFVDTTAVEKKCKGYAEVMDATTAVAAAPVGDCESGDPREDLENGKKIFMQGSGKMPYSLRKFNGGYSCSCPGFTMNIKRNGIQATSCKHLKLIRGLEAEAIRCAEFSIAGSRHVSETLSSAIPASSGKNSTIPGKISLAHPWKIGIDPKNYIMSEKLDGMRAYWSAGKLWTRSGGEIIAPFWFLSGLPNDVDLDGELFLGRKRFDECMSIVRRSDASDDWRGLKYVIFDAPKMMGGILMRLSAISDLIGHSTPYATIHPQHLCQGMEHMMEELTRVELLGGEGLMIRHPTAPHRGGRSNDLLKVKSFHDAEALVIDHEDGKGKYKNMVGSLVCKLKDGSIFKVGSGLADNERTQKSAPKIGTVITFKYFELTKDGIPRFPTFLRVRPDVSSLEFSM